VHGIFRNPIVLFAIAIILAVMPAIAARAAMRPSVDSVAEGLTCQCGCGLTVANCNHPQCEFSVPVRTQIETMIRKGMDRDAIIASFRRKYGEKVLSAPTTEGFNLLAWVVPFLALIGAGGILVAVLGRWDRKPPSDPPGAVPGDAFDSELRKRLDDDVKRDL
jgi:cytochrome c-type biogenesis protein CcmH